jgi:hypothetical protein
MVALSLNHLRAFFPLRRTAVATMESMPDDVTESGA